FISNTSGVINPAAGTATTTTVSTSSVTPVYGHAVTLTATVVPASGSLAPAGSVSFFINGSTMLGTASKSSTGANNMSVLTLMTTATQLQVAGGAAQVVSAFFAAGSGFSNSASTNTVTETVSPVTIAVLVNAGAKVYDGTTAEPTFTASLDSSGVLSGDSVTL